MQKEFTEFFFNGNQIHSELVSELKRNFMRLVTGMYVPPIRYLLRDGTPRSYEFMLEKQFKQ